MMPIINRIEPVARARGITSVKELAERAGLAYNTTHALWNNRTERVDFGTLDKLCAALDAEPGDLLIRVKPGQKE